MKMLRKLENRFFDYQVQSGIQYLNRAKYDQASDLQKAVLEQMRHEFQAVPPLLIHFANPELMAAVWAFTREVLVAGNVARMDRELVAGVTSHLNQCPYCVDVHVAMLHGTGDRDAVRQVLDEKKVDGARPKLVDWAGATLTPGAPVLADPPFSEAEKPYLIGTALLDHYLNRIVNIFLDASPLPAAISNAWAKEAAGKLVGFLVGRRMVSVRAEPGRCVYYAKKDTLPDAFAWAKTNEAVSRGLSSFANVAEEAGALDLSVKARRAVLKTVDKWTGKQMPVSRTWIDAALEKLSEDDRPGAELALLSALASYRVDSKLIGAFRRRQPGDRALVNVVSWGAYAATRRISTWIDGDVAVSRSQKNVA